MTRRTLAIGDLVSVRRPFDRIRVLQVRVVGPGWFIGHRPTTQVCHRAYDDDIISIMGWRA